MKYRSPYQTKVMIRTPLFCLYLQKVWLYLRCSLLRTFRSYCLLCPKKCVIGFLADAHVAVRGQQCRRPNREAKVGGKHSWYSSQSPVFSSPQSYRLLNAAAIFFAVTRQNHYLCKIFVSQLLKAIVEGHAILINTVYLTTSRICRNLLGEVFKRT